MIVYDKSGRAYQLQKLLAEGGEGGIFSLAGQPDRLAKIYKPDKRRGRETKLAWMTANPPSDPGRARGQAAIAWPEALLYAADRQFAGYVMPYIENTRTLLHVFNPSLRRQVLPDFDVRYLHRAARNLASAVHALHTCDYVIGDLNETNVLVAPTALVTVIDVDSFQVRERRDGQIVFYPCPVGRVEYTPAELQGKALPDEVRQPQHDAFALAVLLFQLLVGGSHPFRSFWQGSGDPPPLEEKILNGWFPHAATPCGPVAPPPKVSLDHLYPPLVALMHRCFVDGHENPRKRPLPAEWEAVLSQAEKALTSCANQHYFSGHLAQCPSCGARPAAAVAPPKPPAAVSTSPAVAVTPSARPLVVPPKATAPTSLPSFAAAQAAISSATKTCPNCGMINPGSETYCQKCTADLHGLAICPHCGKPTALGVRSKFCSKCGRGL